MVNSHNKGRSWSRKVVVYLEDEIGLALRVRPLGMPGDDIAVPTDPPLSIEAKNHKAWSPGSWVDQAERQAPPGSIPIVWAHRRGKAEADGGFVLMSGAAFVQLLKGRIE
jgi:hypothetical protein